MMGGKIHTLLLQYRNRKITSRGGELEVTHFNHNFFDGLPLVQKISHQMDLIPGVSFPNKATHRMTPVESEELNKQVNELL